MPLLPDRCPNSRCPSLSGAPFQFQRSGTFVRRCDRRRVQRFLCLVCKKGFSEQTLRVDYRLKRSDLLPRLFLDRVSKVTHRQSARIQGCSRSTEERHFRRLALHCAAFHRWRLDEAVKRTGGLGQVFLMDELETYEHHRKLKPVTVPVLIERESYFVVDWRVGALAPRGKRTPGEEKVLAIHRAREGVRRSESAKVVRECFARLAETAPKKDAIAVLTDQKESYERILKKTFGKRCLHSRTSSKARRDTTNPLWRINHTLARLRDGISRLVRETWAASKLRARLAWHLAIWTAWRNYVRGRTNHEPRTTPAMALGVESRHWTHLELLERRLPEAA